MNIKLPNSKYEAYTLLEMIIVIGIMLVFTSIGLYSFTGLRDSVFANEDLALLKQNIQKAQQSAMLFEKSSDESWVYGVGIDFSDFEGDGVYRLFKWCAPFKTYGDPMTTSEVMAYNPSEILGADLFVNTGTEEDPNNLPVENGYLPVTEVSTGSCSYAEPENKLVRLSGFPDVELNSGYRFGLSGGVESIQNPMYLVFEAVTGRAFLYDANGRPVNYIGSAGATFDNDIVMKLLIYRRNMKDDEITISPLSGEVTLLKTDFDD